MIVSSGNSKPGAADVLQSHFRDLPAISLLVIDGDSELQMLRLPNNAEMLQFLDVAHNERLVRIENFAALKKLHYLSISSNAAIPAINLAALSELEDLKINNNASLTALEGLAGLINLRNLTLMGNPKLGPISGLDSLTKLQTLFFSGASLYEELASLSALHELIITESPLLANIPDSPG